MKPLAPVGFREVVAAVRGDLIAASEYERAKAAMNLHLTAAHAKPTEEELDGYLRSEFGGLMARDSLNKTYVKTQLQQRPARFMKHFLEVRRRLLKLAAGETL